MSGTLMIRITKDRPADVHPIWELTGLVLQPFLDDSLTPTPGEVWGQKDEPGDLDSAGIKWQDRSWGMFRNLLINHYKAIRIDLLTGRTAEDVVRQLQEEALRKLA